MEERLSRLNEMARRVVAANPKEARQVQARQTEITALWDNLKVHTIVYIVPHIFLNVSTDFHKCVICSICCYPIVCCLFVFCFFLSFFYFWRDRQTSRDTSLDTREI